MQGAGPRIGRRLGAVARPTVTLIALLVGLELLKRWGLLPVFVPAPSQVFNEIVISPRLVTANLGPTAFKATVGFFIAMSISVSAGSPRRAPARTLCANLQY